MSIIMNTFNHGDIIASEHNEYKILGNLSQGSFGVTYRAENIRTKEKCIIKKFQPKKESTWEKGLEQFNREAEKLKKIEHNQIPRFFEYFTKDNDYYLAQEYIKGHDLIEEINKGINNEKYVIRLIEDILEVLSFLHSKDLIHRDLKPSNIRRRETDDKIVLIDFGGVKEADQGPGTNLTSESYSPIEQYQGKCYKSSDIYAVGIIAIQSLTGKNSKSEIFPSENQAQNNNPPGIYQPDRIEWHRYAPNVSRELADIIDKMVMRDHKQRYKSAEEALEALRAIQSTGIRTPLNPPIPPIEGTKAPDTVVVAKNKRNIVTAVLVSLSLSVIAVLGVFAVIPVTGKYIENLLNGGEEKVKLNKEFSKDNIKIGYPDNWNIIRSSDDENILGNLAEFTPKKVSKSCNSTKITINIQDLKRVLSVQEYKQSVEEEIKKYNPQAIIKDETQTSTSLSQKNAYELSYSKKENQCETQVLEKGTVKNGKGYHINYEGTKEEYEKYLPVAQAMFESFNIEDEK